MSSKQSFTLIELVLVLGLVSFLFLFSLPNFLRFGALTKLKSQARRIAGAIRYTHELSARTGKFHRLNYNLEKGCYWISQRNKEGAFLKVEDILAKKKVLPKEVRFQDIIRPEGKVNRGTTYTGFSPRGFIEETIVHLSAVNSKKTVSLLTNPLTAETAIHEGYVERE